MNGGTFATTHAALLSPPRGGSGRSAHSARRSMGGPRGLPRRPPSVRCADSSPARGEHALLAPRSSISETADV